MNYTSEVTEDYVSFEIAKLLKEKGFDIPCEFQYINCASGVPFLIDKKDESGCYYKNSEIGDDEYSAPTLQMTMKWLREIYDIHVNLDIHWLHFANSKGWVYIIEKILENGTEYVDSKGDESDKTYYSTYEEACEEAVRYCLTNLI